MLAVGAILGVILAKAIGAAAGGIAAAVTGLVAKAIAAPLVVGVKAAIASTFAAITSAVGPLLAAIFSAVGLAVAAVVVGLAALAPDRVGPDIQRRGAAQAIRGMAVRAGLDQCDHHLDSEVLTPFFTQAWQNVIAIFREQFVGPFFEAWHATRDFFGESFAAFFTETVPEIFSSAWDSVIGILRTAFIAPFFGAWHATRDFFKGSFAQSSPKQCQTFPWRLE